MAGDWLAQGPGTHGAKGLSQEKAYVTGLQAGNQVRDCCPLFYFKYVCHSCMGIQYMSSNCRDVCRFWENCMDIFGYVEHPC